MSLHARGFTLLEFLVVIAISALLLSLAVPSFQTYIRDSQRAQFSTSLYLALNEARAEAINRNTDVVVAAHNGDWNLGWIAFEDRDGDGEPAGGQEPLFESDPVEQSFAVEERDGSELIRFTASGRAVLAAQFTLCADQARHARRVVVELSGRLSLASLDSLTEAAFRAECPA